MSNRISLGQVLLYFSALLLAVVLLAPVFWLFIMSISTPVDLTTIPLKWFPENVVWDNYHLLFSLEENSPAETFLYSVRNSLIVAIVATSVSVVAAIPAAYSLSRFPHKNRSWILYAMIATFMMPPVAIVLPLYTLMSSLSLLNSHAALIIVYCSILLPFTTWLLKSNFDSIPIDLDEAPIIDGASRLQVIWYITMPLAKPALGAAFLMAFLMAWDEFFYALLFTNDIRAKTLPVAIADFAAGRVADYGLISAAGILATLPPVVLAFFMQKTLVAGLVNGGVKG
jgi:multiple sugar transport system permease protein